MESVSDAIIVGGGSCGSFAALNLAKFGVKVTVFEEHGEIGVPSHCAGHLSIRGLKGLGLYPLPRNVVENTISGANFCSPNGRVFSVRFPSVVTCVVNRALFDQYIAEKAKSVGVRYCLGSRVESVRLRDGFVRGVRVKQGEELVDFDAKVVVDAEGISSRISSQAGLPSPNRGRFVSAMQAEVENVGVEEVDVVDVFLGREYALGFYGWLIPRRDGTAKVGLATKTGNPAKCLQKLMLRHPVASRKLGEARIVRSSFHPITLGGSIPKTYANGFLAVGDVASQVKPTTGGGVILGLTCARIAAETVCEALREDDFSGEFLSAYQRRCETILGFDMRVMLRARRLLDGLSDEQLDDVVGFCARYGLDKALRRVEDIDFQGQALVRTLRSPRMVAAFFHFLYLYLSVGV